MPDVLDVHMAGSISPLIRFDGAPVDDIIEWKPEKGFWQCKICGWSKKAMLSNCVWSEHYNCSEHVSKLTQLLSSQGVSPQQAHSMVTMNPYHPTFYGWEGKWLQHGKEKYMQARNAFIQAGGHPADPVPNWVLLANPPMDLPARTAEGQGQPLLQLADAPAADAGPAAAARPPPPPGLARARGAGGARGSGARGAGSWGPSGSGGAASSGSGGDALQAMQEKVATTQTIVERLEMKIDDMEIGHSALCATVQAQRDLIKLLAENLEKSWNGEQIDAEALERLKLAKWQ